MWDNGRHISNSDKNVEGVRLGGGAVDATSINAIKRLVGWLKHPM